MRALTIAGICGWVAACGGHKERPQPRSDEPGRLRLVYELDVDRAVDDKAAELRRDLEAGLAADHIVATVTVSMTSLGALTVTPGAGATRLAIEQRVKAAYGDTVESRACEAPAGPDAICIGIAAAYADALRKTALHGAVETIRARLVASKVADPLVTEQAGQIIVEFPTTDAQGLSIRARIARTGLLELKVVDDGSAYMRQLFAHVGTTGAGEAVDARAIEAGITASVEQWQPEDGSPSHTDYYLVAHDRESLLSPEQARRLGCPTGPLDHDQVRCTVTGRVAIERYVGELSEVDPTFRLPTDRELGYELVEPDAGATVQRPFWRSYYLDRAVRLTGSSIADARPSLDPNTNRPLVLFELDRAGTRAFGDLTAEIVGKKLAIILDGRITSAPIINGPIRGGRASITMGGTDPSRQEAERDELVTVLETGALPAPLREVSSTVVP